VDQLFPSYTSTLGMNRLCPRTRCSGISVSMKKEVTGDSSRLDRYYSLFNDSVLIS
jgi:hypothetical protein